MNQYHANYSGASDEVHPKTAKIMESNFAAHAQGKKEGFSKPPAAPSIKPSGSSPSTKLDQPAGIGIGRKIGGDESTKVERLRRSLLLLDSFYKLAA